MFAIFYDDFCYGSTFELGIVSRKLAGRRSVGYPLEVRGFSLLLSVQTGLGPHPDTYVYNDYWVLLPRGNSAGA